MMKALPAVLALLVACASEPPTPVVTTISCSAFYQEFDSILGPVNGLLDEVGDLARAMTDGTVSHDEGADAYFLMADEMEQIRRDLESMGPAPPELAETQRLILRASELFQDALEIGSRGLRTDDHVLIEEMETLLREGAALAGEAADVRRECLS